MNRGTPDEVIFARDSKTGKAVTWGQLRESQDEDFRLRCLAIRLESFLVDQYSEVVSKKVSGTFPLAILCLAGIGILGEIFYALPKPKNAEDENREIFCRFCNKVHPRFGRAPKQDFQIAFAARWGVDKPGSVSAIFYTYFRNTLVHGYYGRAVFVTGDNIADLLLRDDGCVLVRLDWLFGRFLEAARCHISALLKEEKNGSLRRNALRYLKILLDENRSSENPTERASI